MANVWVYTKGRDECEERAPPGKDDGRSHKARAARNLGARGGGGCSVQLAHHQCRGSPSPPPTPPRRAAPAAIPRQNITNQSVETLNALAGFLGYFPASVAGCQALSRSLSLSLTLAPSLPPSPCLSRPLSPLLGAIARLWGQVKGVTASSCDTSESLVACLCACL